MEESLHTWEKRSKGGKSVRRNDRDVIVSRVQGLKHAHSLKSVNLEVDYVEGENSHPILRQGRPVWVFLPTFCFPRLVRHRLARGQQANSLVLPVLGVKLGVRRGHDLRAYRSK